MSNPWVLGVFECMMYIIILSVLYKRTHAGRLASVCVASASSSVRWVPVTSKMYRSLWMHGKTTTCTCYVVRVCASVFVILFATESLLLSQGSQCIALTVF